MCFAESSLEVVHLVLKLPLLLLRGKVTVVLSRLNGLLHVHVQEGGVVRKLTTTVRVVSHRKFWLGDKFGVLVACLPN